MMAATGKLEQENLECDTCAKWKEKYLESQKQRRYLRECVNLYEGQFEKLKKAHEEDRSRADREKEEKLKETTRRVSLENEISTLRSQISLLQEKAGSGMPCGNEDLASLQIQISDSKMEIDRLKGVAEKEKKRADAMRKSAEEAKKEAAEAKNLADIEAKKAEEYRCQIEKLKTETDETRSKMALEISKFRDENKKLKVEKKRLFQEKKHADSEKLNVAERGKLVEANERLSKQLEELKNKIEELQEEKRKLMNSSRSTESPGVRDNILSSPMAKMKRLKKPAVSEKLKADEQKKLVEANQYLSKQVEEFKKKIDELQNKNHELINSRKSVEALRVSPDKVINSEMKSMKHLKKTLKLEKMRVKHAKLVAKLESERHNIVRQQLGCLKHEALQFLNRFYLLDDCFNHEIGDIDDPEKTEHLADVQRLISKRKFMEEDHCHMYGQRKHRRRDKTCKTMDASNHFSRIPECVPELLPISRGNSARSISGIDSKLESLHEGSKRKKLESSAIDFSVASFSDSRLVDSQGRGAFSVTTAAKLAGEDKNPPSSEVSNLRYNENFAGMAENSVKNHSNVERVATQIKKRKRIPDVTESVEYLHSAVKKLNSQMEETVPVLHAILNRQVNEPLERGNSLILTPQCQLSANPGGYCKGNWSSHNPKVIMPHLRGIHQWEDSDILGNRGNEDICEDVIPFPATLKGHTRSCEDGRTCDRETTVLFEEIADGDYMKLLDLDNAFDEERYRIARKMPLSPTLPQVEFQNKEALVTDESHLLVKDELFDGLSNGKKNLVSSYNVDVIEVEIDSNISKINNCETPCNLTLHEMESPSDRHEHIESRETGNIPTHCIVFSGTKDIDSISRVFLAMKKCLAGRSLDSLADASRAVQSVLPAIAEGNLAPKEKACMVFSVLHYGFCVSALRSDKNLTGNFDSFAGSVNPVIYDAEMRNLILKLFPSDELLELIEDFLINGEVLVSSYQSSGALISVDSAIKIKMDNLGVTLSYEKASTDQLVAGSVMLASICIAIDQIGFLCEASYNIFWSHKHAPISILTILHTFAYCCEDYVSLKSHSLLMSVLKSLVTSMEKECSLNNISSFSFMGGCLPEFRPCSGCPFTEDSISVGDIILLLFEKLRASLFDYDDKRGEQISAHEESMTHDDGFCSLMDMEAQSVAGQTFCNFIDVLSLVELVTRSMSWEWVCNKVVPQLVKFLDSCHLDTFSAAIIVLLGQLGRHGIDASGYEDAEVNKLRCRLSDLLIQMYSGKGGGLPVQVATINALLKVVPLGFEELVRTEGRIPATATQCIPEDLLSNWFSSLSNEHKCLAIKLLESAHVNEK